MAIKQLDDEQIRTWTLEQKDRWWLKNVWRGDMPQLTVRSAVTGMMLGMILSLTNLYVGAKTGWTLGVGITSVILAFAMFKVLTRIGLGSEFTVLENNCMQSIATAAGYMTAPLISSLAAYMMVTEAILPCGQVFVWIIAIGVLGVLFAFPLKRRFINDEQHPFPEGRAAGVVMDSLHEGHAAEGLFKAKLLTICGALSAFLMLIKSGEIMNLTIFKIGNLWVRLPAFPEYLDGWIYRLSERLGWQPPQILGTDLRQLGVRPDTDLVMMAAGGLMGIRTGVSLLLGAVINYCILAPWMIQRGDIEGVVQDGVTTYGFKQITMWGLWWGVAMMTTASLFAFFAKPQIIISSFQGLFRRKDESQADVLKNIELPMRVFVVGIPIVGGLVVVLAWWIFDVVWWQGAIAIPLIFVFTLIAVNSTALTAITPTGALGKLTQLTYAMIARGNITTNLATASITGEVASNSSNLLMDIKPGYMLGAKPRQQAIGHVMGIFAGALVAVPIFYLVFLKISPSALLTGSYLDQPVEQLTSVQYPMPSAVVWKAVAVVLTKGVSNLEMSARWAALAGGILGLVFELLRIATKGRFWLSGVAVGLAAVIPFPTCFSMFLGAFLFWLAGRKWKGTGGRLDKIFVQNQEPMCAGIIAGGALMGITVILIVTFLLPRLGY